MKLRWSSERDGIDMNGITGKILDANGNQCPHATWIDTQTGEIETYIEPLGTDSTGRIARQVETYPAPLTFVSNVPYVTIYRGQSVTAAAIKLDAMPPLDEIDSGEPIIVSAAK